MATFVLVHGAWHDTWCWSRLAHELQMRGHAVVATSLNTHLSGFGLRDHTEAVETALSVTRDAVLVAHGMSGLVAPLAARHPAVRSMVLLAAMVPTPGLAWLDNGPAPYAPPLRHALLSDVILDADGLAGWTAKDATRLMYHDSDPHDAVLATAQLSVDSPGVYLEPSPALPDRRVPTTYLACRDDRALDPAWGSAAAADLLGATVQEFDSGHTPFWSAPGRLSRTLETLAHRTPALSASPPR